MAGGEEGWSALIGAIKELGPVGWFMLGVGSVLAAAKRNILILGDKADMAKQLGRLESKLESALADVAERDALITELKTRNLGLEARIAAKQ